MFYYTQDFTTRGAANLCDLGFSPLAIQNDFGKLTEARNDVASQICKSSYMLRHKVAKKQQDVGAVRVQEAATHENPTHPILCLKSIIDVRSRTGGLITGFMWYGRSREDCSFNSSSIRECKSKCPRAYAHFSDPNDDVIDMDGDGYEWTNPQMSAPVPGAMFEHSASADYGVIHQIEQLREEMIKRFERTEATLL